MMGKRLTTEEFIKKAKLVHGNKYNYSQVNYKNTGTKIKIICPEHGVFEQQPGNHLNGQGCPQCGLEKRKLTTKDFIKKARLIHGETYDYSLASYKNALTKIKIICSIHGVFEQFPQSHLAGYGCPKCGIEKRKLKVDEIKERLSVFDKKYIFNIKDNTEISDIIDVTKIATNEKFKKSLNYMLPFQDPYELKEKRKNKFIEAANKKFHGKFDYSLVDYVNRKTPVIIIHPKYGKFVITPENHLMLYLGYTKEYFSTGQIV